MVKGPRSVQPRVEASPTTFDEARVKKKKKNKNKSKQPVVIQESPRQQKSHPAIESASAIKAKKSKADRKRPLLESNAKIEKKKTEPGAPQQNEDAKKIKKKTKNKFKAAVEIGEENSPEPALAANDHDDKPKAKKRKTENGQPKEAQPGPSENLQAGSAARKVIPDGIRVINYTLSPKFSAARQLFLKQVPREDNSVVVANVSPLVSLEILTSIVAHLAGAQPAQAHFQRSTALDGDLEQGQRTAKIIFESAALVQALLQRTTSCGTLCAADFGELETKAVYAELCDDYRKQFTPTADMQDSINAYVQDYDARVALEKRLAKKGRTEPDDEGWVTVTAATKKKAKAVKLRTGENTIMGSLKNKDKKKQPSLPFYTFQMKEGKMKKMEELRAKYEEDKQRIAQSKAARTFKPL